jgi:superfamily II DNA/RNA helicase
MAEYKTISFTGSSKSSQSRPGRPSRGRSFGGRPSNGRSKSFHNSRSPRRDGGRAGKNGPKKDYIDPSRFVKAAKPVEQEDYVPTHAFADFDINPLLKQNLIDKGFTTPSAIQDQSIPHGLQGRDIIGIADTGTGKTAAFGIPILQQVMLSDGKVLIVAPTRELAQQIDVEFRSIAKGSNLKGAVLIGGTGMGAQLRDLKRNPQIIIGTPGRIKDHLERGSLKLHDCKFVVLDEVDRMLDMGFIGDMTHILKLIPSERQSFFFSATMDTKVRALIETFSHDPVMVSVKTGDTGENIHQDIVRVGDKADKINKLHDLLIGGDISKAIIFDDTQRSVERLSRELVSRGFKADAIHGGKTQGQRQRSLEKFKKEEITILVATDVAARGIDVKDISHVINFSTPQTYSDYVHRIGRAGRAGKVGHALTFIEHSY